MARLSKFPALRFAIGPILVFLSSVFPVGISQVQGQAVELILRDLSRIKTPSIRFDEQGVFLPNGTHYDWGQVLTAELDADRQRQFQEFVQQLGLPLFRIRRRLNDRDWNSLSEVVEPVYARQQQDAAAGSSRRLNYVVALATFYSRLQQGNRTGAVAPFLEACRIRREANWTTGIAADIDLTSEEVQTLFTTGLLPIWFDEAEGLAVKSSLQSLPLEETTLPGPLIYGAAALIVSGPLDQAIQVLSKLARSTEPTVRQWLPVLQVQLEIKRGINGPATAAMRESDHELSGPLRATSSYLLARQMSKIQDDYDAVVLDLLQIPANWGDSLKELSAAALYHAALLAGQAGRADEAAIYRSELSNHFKKTHHGKLVLDQ